MDPYVVSLVLLGLGVVALLVGIGILWFRRGRHSR